MKFWMPPTGTLFSSRSIIMTGKRPSAQRNNMKWLRPAAFPASSWSRARRSLASPHPDVVSLLTAAAPKASPAHGRSGCRELPNTAVVLSGMSDMAQVTENLRLFGQFQPLSIAETELLQQAVSILESLPLIPCTGCNYCKGCPKGVRISSAFEAYNSCLRFDQMADLRARIQSCGIADCIECGKCEGHCPQHIAIPKELKRVLACAEAEAIG